MKGSLCQCTVDVMQTLGLGGLPYTENREIIVLLSASPEGEARCRCRKVWLTRNNNNYYYLLCRLGRRAVTAADTSGIND
jgi:hypothetical protein